MSAPVCFRSPAIRSSGSPLSARRRILPNRRVDARLQIIAGFGASTPTATVPPTASSKPSARIPLWQIPPTPAISPLPPSTPLATPFLDSDSTPPPFKAPAGCSPDLSSGSFMEISRTNRVTDSAAPGISFVRTATHCHCDGRKSSPRRRFLPLRSPLRTLKRKSGSTSVSRPSASRSLRRRRCRGAGGRCRGNRRRLGFSGTRGRTRFASPRSRRWG